MEQIVARSLDAVVFDLDGTLVDTAPDLHAHLNEILAEFDRPGLSLETMMPLIGGGARAFLQRGFEASGGLPEGHDLETLFAEFIERYTAEPLRFGAPYAGVIATLEELRTHSVKLGVCTNKAQAPTDRLLEALGLDRYFPVVIGGDALTVRKPDPGHIAAVLDRLSADHRAAVMVGDSDYDVLGARAAGLPCVVVSFGYTDVPARQLGADRVIDHFADLPAALHELLPAAA
jgi:phosphoglycolate phosphatase